MGLYDLGDELEESLQNKLHGKTKSSVYWMLLICAICSALIVMLFLAVCLFSGGSSGYAIAAGAFMIALVLSLSSMMDTMKSASSKDDKVP